MDVKQFLSDLKNINPKNPGGWPWAIKIAAFTAIFLAVLAAGFFFDWQDQLQTYSRDQEEEGKLKDTFLTKKKEAINLDLIRKQLLDTQQSFGALLKQLPNKAEMDALLTDINQAGLGRGLLFDLFKPEREAVKGVLTEQPITIKVEGNYDDLGKFASDIAQLPRIVTLSNISISPGQGGMLTMDATAKTYRYLDENELAAQKAASAKAGAPK
jgi:type IV pilus assembly protein PilO